MPKNDLTHQHLRTRLMPKTTSDLRVFLGGTDRTGGAIYLPHDVLDNLRPDNALELEGILASFADQMRAFATKHEK